MEDGGERDDLVRVQVKSPELRRVILKHRKHLTRKDVSALAELGLANPEEDFEELVLAYLEEKYEKGMELIGDTESYDELARALGLSRHRMLLRLNNLSKGIIDNRINNFLRKRAGKMPHKMRDRRHLKRLLKHKSKRRILLSPGPVMTSFTVKNSLIQQDISHRDSDFEEIMKRLQENALKLFEADDDHRVLFISGSGTAGMEAVLSSCIPTEKRVLIASNGAFGERLKEIADLHDLKVAHLRKEWGEPILAQEVEDMLAKYPDIFAIALPHHETSVGMLNPIHEIGKLAREKDKLMIVDGISSVGAERLSVRDDNIDVCITSSNKCIHSFSGVTLVCVHDRVWNRIKDVKPRSYYLDLKKYHAYSTSLNQTPFTPNVASLHALDAALQELLEEGTNIRRLRYIELNTMLRLEFAKLGFGFLDTHDSQSHGILTVKTPEDVLFKDFYKELKRKGFVIYACKPPLGERYFQVANMGELTRQQVYDFMIAVKGTLKQLRKPREK